MHFFPYLLFFYFFFNVCMRVGPDQTEFLNVARFFSLFWTNEYQPAKEYEKNKEQKRADNYVILQPNDPLFFSNVWYMYDVSIRARARTIVSSVSALHEIEKRLIFFCFSFTPLRGRRFRCFFWSPWTGRGRPWKSLLHTREPSIFTTTAHPAQR